jgi:acyl-homoserine-lactone acylase
MTNGGERGDLRVREELVERVRGAESIPIHGGSEHGCQLHLQPFDAEARGYRDAPGVPRAESILTYSLSTDPASPYFGDQTLLYSAKQWVPMALTEPAVAASQIASYTVAG